MGFQVAGSGSLVTCTGSLAALSCLELEPVKLHKAAMALSRNTKPFPRFRPLAYCLLSVALAYLIGCAALFTFQRNLLYSPQPTSTAKNKDYLELPSQAGTSLVLMHNHDGPEALIYLGGNSEDVAASMPSLLLNFPNHALYLLHYPGFGGSAGKPSEAALFSDALALFDAVFAEHNRIVVVGGSLGSGVATYVASKRSVRRLVLVTPFDSLQDIYARKLPFLPIRWLMLDKFESAQYAKHVRAPTLLLVAANDEMIPFDSSRRLLESFQPGIASLKKIDNADHNSIYSNSQYFPLIKGFI
jgi:uncharacterized protein